MQNQKEINTIKAELPPPILPLEETVVPSAWLNIAGPIVHGIQHMIEYMLHQDLKVEKLF